ncbi:MAG: ABC transporter ATP-binding protein [Rhodococcus sp. (in: high G+C Gram-positive bacteria)]|uniref:ABC transporter ATP-binding protein n=1 Tax=Nocardiaceae TaxID=85025 RepID=UPI001E57F324|nr:MULTISPECIES: ABC transporter ATP-binding protein [Rhodococcus]MCC8927250.1 ABC transporter ATP-binding protein [Rhodococcus sp. I2R]MCZ4275108.1 ABC transporter ATP-binding protein [Rhodococcus yunnanensis]
MNGLSVRGLVASYGAREVLSGVDLDLAAGEMLAILGPSGCGKTTLLRSIAGLHRIDRGRVELDERVLAEPASIHIAPEDRKIGLMPQEGGLFPHLSVGENIGFGLVKAFPHKRIADRKQRRARIEAMLELVGLPGATDARPSEMSGGQQQRIALARALAPKPAVILMDEPFASLDPGLRVGIRQEVRALLKESKTPALLVTHDRAEAMTTADRVTVLLGGRAAQTATPEQLYRLPSSIDVGTFVGESILLDADRTGAAAETVLGTIAVVGSAAGRGQVLVRPEQLEPVIDPNGSFHVVATEFAGPYTLVTSRHVVTGDSVTSWVTGSGSIAIGSTVRLVVDGPVPFFGEAASAADEH